jgi:signal transduction histidine kinase
MNPNKNLTLRLSIALLIASAAGSIIFSVIFFTAYERMEHKMLEVLVGYASYEAKREISSVKQLEIKDKPEYIEIYHSNKHKIPEILSRYPPGFYHDIKIDTKIYHLAVIQSLDGIKYITFDITDIENEEDRVGLLVLLAALLSVLFSCILIYWLSKNVIEPVRLLAAEVANINVNQRNVRIADKFQDVEVSSIAKSFDHYLDRVDQFIEREQSFTSTASHELRTPLSIISTSAELLQEKVNIPESSKHYLNNIRRNSQDMSEIITALLFLSRESNISVSSAISEEANLKEITNKILEDFKFDNNTRYANITIISIDNSKVKALYSHIYIVIKNILVNAVKYSNNQPITITISDHLLEVSDKGPGIANNEYKDLYKKGTKGSNSQGNGLGLFIVKSFCDYYRWKIDISSSTSSDSGTTVSIEFNT